MATIRLLTDVFGNDLESTVDREQHQGDGSPEGTVIGNPGDVYRDIAGPALYVKQTGTGTTTGWGAAAVTVPDAADVDFDPTGLDFFTATDVQGALEEADAPLALLADTQSITGATAQEQLDSIVAALVALGLATDDR